MSLETELYRLLYVNDSDYKSFENVKKFLDGIGVGRYYYVERDFDDRVECLKFIRSVFHQTGQYPELKNSTSNMIYREMEYLNQIKNAITFRFSIDVFNRLINSQPHEDVGICSLSLIDVHRFFVSWEHFSGNIRFPVPDPTGKDNPVDMYFMSDCWVGEYGNLRRDLCHHIIQKMTEDFNNYTGGLSK